ncbi:MAG: DUF2125 domain-containing protein [Paracoccaceae bacterium]|nr:MAG: DUF2125 domain-containing protein [Paracoccaceae bacterium]
MRWLVWVVVGAAVLWGGLWFAMATAVSRGTAAAFDQMSAQGLLAERAGIAVNGFPNRLDLTVTEPRLSDPVTGTGWTAPFVQVFTLTWKPWHIIAAFPPEQRLALPGASVTLASDRLQASLVVQPSAALPLDRLAVAGDALHLTLAPGAAAPATLAVRTLRLGTRRDPSRADTHEIGLDLSGIAPDPAFFAALPPGTTLPGEIDRLRVVAFAGLSAPLDRFAGDARPQLLRLDLREASLGWGGIAFWAEGSLAPDAEGFAEGRIDIRLTGWRAALDAAVAAGLIRPEIAPTWAEFARRLAETSPDPDRLDLPLTLGRGRMSLGPLPLGPAPRLTGTAGG